MTGGHIGTHITDAARGQRTEYAPEPQDSGRTLLDELHGAELTPKRLGVWGERYARAWLEHRGWTTLSTNWRTRYGELDLVMLDPSRILVFMEVKTRRTSAYGLPQEAVNAHKRLTLRRAGVQWLLDPAHHTAHGGVRFDVLAITVAHSTPTVLHIQEAF